MVGADCRLLQQMDVGSESASGCCLQVISPRGRCLYAAVVVLFVCYSYIDSMNFESYYASLTIV
jgi:hypothetical protein